MLGLSVLAMDLDSLGIESIYLKPNETAGNVAYAFSMPSMYSIAPPGSPKLLRPTISNVRGARYFGGT